MSTEPSRLQVRHHPIDHRYELSVDDVPAAFVVYEVSADTMDVRYTKVHDGFARRGLSSLLVARVLAEARGRGLAVLPTCSFVAAFIKEHADEYLELVPESRRREFEL